MSQTVQVPGVGTLQFPDGMSQADMAAAIKKNFPEIHAPAPRMSPADMKASREARYQQLQDQMVSEMPWYQKLAVGAGKAVYDTGRGIGELIGKVSPQDIAQARSQDAALMRTGAGKTGNALGYVGMAVPAMLAGPEVAALGVGSRMALGGAAGAAQGYAAPYASQGEHVTNALVGAGMGALIPGAGAAAGKVVRGLATPEARALINEGVKLTPGQMIGGAAKRVEDSLSSIPIVGSAIRKGQNRSLDTYANAAANRVLGELGMALPKGVKTAREGLTYAQDAVSNAYNSTLSQMKFAPDAQLKADVSTIFKKYAPKLGKNAEELEAFIQDGIAGKLGAGATGQVGHEIQSDLGKQATGLMRKDLQSDRTLGYAVKELQDSVKAAMKRQNSPELNALYAKASNAYKNLSKLQKAATYAGSTDSRITPTTLMQAVRSSDKSFGKKALSQGRVAMQDLAEAGKDVLPSKVNDSGTAGRLLLADMATGGGAAAAGHLPAALALGAAAHGFYSRPGQFLMERALAPRPNPVTNYLAQIAQSRLVNSPANSLLTRPLLPQGTPVQGIQQ